VLSPDRSESLILIPKMAVADVAPPRAFRVGPPGRLPSVSRAHRGNLGRASQCGSLTGAIPRRPIRASLLLTGLPVCLRQRLTDGTRTGRTECLRMLGWVGTCALTLARWASFSSGYTFSSPPQHTVSQNRASEHDERDGERIPNGDEQRRVVRTMSCVQRCSKTSRK
jgi:hypothetical protein